ncbi:hypothetical protein [uncultured Trichococcus sp.]|uniref:hypothetical protein n=1 Tax=uncultured Trichococcus sp. TaxID=189665 RepID=UPI0029C9183E|nr:hypothetical protein [uncultured Trichococcus sp.]
MRKKNLVLLFAASATVPKKDGRQTWLSIVAAGVLLPTKRKWEPCLVCRKAIIWDCSPEETTQKQGPTPAKTLSPKQDTENQQSTTAKPSFTGAQLPVIR